MTFSVNQTTEAAAVAVCRKLEKAGVINDVWRTRGSVYEAGPMPDALRAGVDELFRRLEVAEKEVAVLRSLEDPWVLLGQHLLRRQDITRAEKDSTNSTTTLVWLGTLHCIVNEPFESVVTKITRAAAPSGRQ